jgi:NAD(P)-dependent dehydrogenase (short-subunit alcohol dehydrogenase family)
MTTESAMPQDASKMTPEKLPRKLLSKSSTCRRDPVETYHFDEQDNSSSGKQGKTALVTGGNRGIGLEVVKSILEDSPKHFVFLGCRDLDAGQALVQTLCQTYGERVEAVQIDVTSPDSIASVVKVLSIGGRHLDILVNNAGILLEADGAHFDIENVYRTMSVNFEGVVAVTEAFLPMLASAPGGGQVLSTSSGCGTRALGLLSEGHRCAFMDPKLDLPTLRRILGELVDGLQDSNNEYHSIPTVGYGLSKMGVNCLTQILARDYPTMFINSCSPGFCNTGMCANYTGKRKPKDPALGASVFRKVLFGKLGQGQNGAFFKESSKPDTPLDLAESVLEPWVALPDK